VPHPATAASSTITTAIARMRRPPRVSIENAIDAFTIATSADRPYTPNRLASCATGSTVTWTVAQRYPRKTTEEISAQELRGDPRGGRNEQGRRTNPPDQDAGYQRRNGRVKRQIGRQQQHREDSDRRCELTESRDHCARPIDRADEVDHSRDKAEQERAVRRAGRADVRYPPLAPAMPLDGPPCERDEQRNERNPRDCRMTVFRETQREQDARGQG
jgi:hypothetical protein